MFICRDDCLSNLSDGPFLGEGDTSEHLLGPSLEEELNALHDAMDRLPGIDNGQYQGDDLPLDEERDLQRRPHDLRPISSSRVSNDMLEPFDSLLGGHRIPLVCLECILDMRACVECEPICFRSPPHSSMDCSSCVNMHCPHCSYHCKPTDASNDMLNTIDSPLGSQRESSYIGNGGERQLDLPRDWDTYRQLPSMDERLSTWDPMIGQRRPGYPTEREGDPGYEEDFDTYQNRIECEFG